MTNKLKFNGSGITPSEAVIMECKFGIESALSIFTMTCISAPQSVIVDGKNKQKINTVYYTIIK